MSDGHGIDLRTYPPTLLHGRDCTACHAVSEMASAGRCCDRHYRQRGHAGTYAGYVVDTIWLLLRARERRRST